MKMGCFKRIVFELEDFMFRAELRAKCILLNSLSNDCLIGRFGGTMLNNYGSHSTRVGFRVPETILMFVFSWQSESFVFRLLNRSTIFSCIIQYRES